MRELFREKLAALANQPGCYQMLNQNGEIIYVGKAKDLKARVSSYFTLYHTGKTARMVEEIADFKTIVTNSEQEALLLEINLIQTYYPKYNVLLKDDKSYPYLLLTNEAYPRLIIARKYRPKMGTAYGPFANSGAAYTILKLLNQVIPFRKCRVIPKRPCFYYHLGQCLGPCTKPIAESEITELKQRLHQFFSGHVQTIRDQLRARMLEAANNLAFEEAGKIKVQLASIEEVLDQQKIDLDYYYNLDVIGFHQQGDYLSIVILIYRLGRLVGEHAQVLPLFGDPEEALSAYIMQYYHHNPHPDEILMAVNAEIDVLKEALKCQITTPLQGDKSAILALAGQNALKKMEEYFIYQNEFSPERQLAVLEELGSLLAIKAPYQIELYDNSHIAGDAAVGVMVAFTNGQPNKKLYRKYKLSAEVAGNDAGSMQEVLRRRLARLITEGSPPPSLLLLDGGLIQVNVALSVLKEVLLDVPVAGLVKDDRHRLRALIGSDGVEREIAPKSPLFHFLTRMQDEVHRFAISYFRERKTRAITVSLLDQVPGLGPKRQARLLEVFGTIARIAQASVTELSQYLPPDVAKRLKAFLETEK